MYHYINYEGKRKFPRTLSYGIFSDIWAFGCTLLSCNNEVIASNIAVDVKNY